MLLNHRVLVICLLACPSSAFATGIGFDQFTPLTGDVGTRTLPEAMPYKLSSPNFSQITIVARDVNQAKRFDSGSYDMITANETGPDAGRYLFNGFETDQAGIQRTDLTTMTTMTIWSSPTASLAPNSHVAFDASRWTPWGSLLTAEESWSSRPGSSSYGRLFEVTNPLAEPADIKIVQRSILPRVGARRLGVRQQAQSVFYR